VNPLANLRQKEQVLDEPTEPPHLLAGIGQNLGTLGLRQLAFQEFEVAADRGQRGPQLVRRVSHQLPLRGQDAVDTLDELIEDARERGGVGVARVLLQAFGEVTPRRHLGCCRDDQRHSAQHAATQPTCQQRRDGSRDTTEQQRAGRAHRNQIVVRGATVGQNLEVEHRLERDQRQQDDQSGDQPQA